MGVRLAENANAWSSICDRNLKENFAEINEREILELLSRMPITRWNLKGQDPSVLQIGPVAQDFHGVFQLGDDNRLIDTGDALGVSLAAFQGLYKIVQEKNSRIEALEARLAMIENLVRGGLGSSSRSFK